MPVIAFGHNDLYRPVKLNGVLGRIQQLLTGKRFPLYVGRGFILKSFGMLPHRKAINIVVGKSVDTPHIESPSQTDIDIIHRKYIENLTLLYEEYKDKFAKDRVEELVIS